MPIVHAKVQSKYSVICFCFIFWEVYIWIELSRFMIISKSASSCCSKNVWGKTSAPWASFNCDTLTWLLSISIINVCVWRCQPAAFDPRFQLGFNLDATEQMLVIFSYFLNIVDSVLRKRLAIADCVSLPASTAVIISTLVGKSIALCFPAMLNVTYVNKPRPFISKGRHNANWTLLLCSC